MPPVRPQPHRVESGCRKGLAPSGSRRAAPRLAALRRRTRMPFPRLRLAPLRRARRRPGRRRARRQRPRCSSGPELGQASRQHWGSSKRVAHSVASDHLLPSVRPARTTNVRRGRWWRPCLLQSPTWSRQRRSLRTARGQRRQPGRRRRRPRAKPIAPNGAREATPPDRSRRLGGTSTTSKCATPWRLAPRPQCKLAARRSAASKHELRGTAAATSRLQARNGDSCSKEPTRQSGRHPSAHRWSMGENLLW